MSDFQISFASFAFFWCFELLCFGCQRAMLLISRTVNVPNEDISMALMPNWYVVTPLCVVGKWLSLVAILYFGGIWIALATAFGGFLLGTIIPIPYRTLYTGSFLRSVDRNFPAGNPGRAHMLDILRECGFEFTFYAGTLKRAVLGRPLHPDRLRAQFWLKEFGFGDLHPSPPRANESPSPKGNAVVDEEPEREAGDGEWCDICTCRVTPDDDNRCPDCKWPL